MKLRFLFFLFVFLISGCSSNTSGGSFAFDSMIKWNNTIYVDTGTGIDKGKISNLLGEIEVYSQKEVDSDTDKTYSNKYKVGTRIYEIKGEDAKNIIAVEVEPGVFKTAENIELLNDNLKNGK